MKHKLKIYCMSHPARRLWYTDCKCGWAPSTSCKQPDGEVRYGRPTWDAALAIGIAHLREDCIHER